MYAKNSGKNFPGRRFFARLLKKKFASIEFSADYFLETRVSKKKYLKLDG